MNIINAKQAKEEFQSFLKKGKHRITPERFEVLDTAFEFEEHFTADELFARMKAHNSNISRATVYNTLELLSQCELLSKRNFGDGRTSYELRFNRKNHDHLICANCGKIIEFYRPEIQKIVNDVCRELGFDNIDYSFNIFGRCKNPADCPHTKYVFPVK